MIVIIPYNKQNKRKTITKQTQRNTNKNEKKEKNEKVVDSISFFSDSRRNHLYQLFQQGSNWEHEFVIEQIGFFENKYCNVPINQCGVLVNGWIKNYKPAHEGRTTQDINATPSNWI